MDERQTVSPSPTIGKNYKKRLVGLCLSVIAVIGITAGLIIFRPTGNRIEIPTDIAQKTFFQLYVPASLPDGFMIVSNSYNVADGALLFYAEDSKGNIINFSEQTKPTDFDFNTLYERTLRDSRRIPDAPYESIIGESEQDTLMLSITAESTWLIITTKAPGGSALLEQIAHHITTQK